MFNSFGGEVYEVEPVYLAYLTDHGVDQARRYVIWLNDAAQRNRLDGYYQSALGRQYYNWNDTEFHLGPGGDWPGKLRTKLTLPGAQGLDFVADFAEDGLVVYWFELDPTVPVPPRYVDELPDRYRRLLRERNWDPATQQVRPRARVLSWQEACGHALIFTGQAIIAVTIVEDMATLGVGTVDDIITISGGYLLINWGQRLATFVPAR
jgi:hypothetical protein